MANVVRYVNAASSGGDGTTNATAGAQAAYASLSAWEAAEQTNLVTDGDTHEVRCEGSTADTTALTLAGWTTDSTHTITIIAQAGVGRHDGSYDTGAYRLEVAGTCMDIQVAYVFVLGLQVFINSASDAVDGISFNGVGNCEAGWCIIKGTAGGGWYHTGVSLYNGTNYYVHDCTIYDCGDFSGGGSVYGGVDLDMATTGSVAYIYNNTFYNCGNGGCINGRFGTAYVKNNVAQVSVGTTSDCYRDAGANFTFHANSATNISDDGTEPAGKNATVSFVAVGSDDYHLASGDTAAKEYGTDLSSDSDLDSLFTASTTDIDNTARTATWDAGSHELSAGGGGATPKGVFGLALDGPMRRVVY